MGSPEFSLPSLEALAGSFDVSGVVTQPDRPAGRGRKLTPPPIKTLADELGIPVIQPRRLADGDALSMLKQWNPDLIVVTAFGQILRPEVLDLPPHGSLNVHASLLPRWRGAAPIQAAILHGDQRTGVTIMKMDTGLDTGPILSQQELAISDQETAGSLSPKLAQFGAQLLIETLPAYLNGDLQAIPQEGEPSYAPMLKKSDGELDFKQSAIALERKIRAYQPWPGTFITWNNERLKIHQARTMPIIASEKKHVDTPGRHLILEDYPAVITGEGVLILEQVQPAGKKPMPGPVFLHGAREWI